MLLHSRAARDIVNISLNRTVLLVSAIVAGFLCAVPLAGLPERMPPHPDKPGVSTEDRLSPLSLSETVREGGYTNTGAYRFPATGAHQVLVLMVGFVDLGFDSVSTPDFYRDLFTGSSGTTMNFRQYYLDMSNGALDLSFTIIDVGTAPEAAAYYGANDPDTGNDLAAGELVAWAVEQAILDHDADTDFATFDNDSDGNVDAVIVIHAGIGEEAAGSGDTEEDPDAIWSHRWDLAAALGVPSTSDVLPTADGVTCRDYTIQPEYVRDPGDSTIGVFVHEFGHILGLPDLYDTSGQTDGIGDWGLMGKGAWLGPNYLGSVPAPLSPWSREQLGWVTVTDATVSSAARTPATPKSAPVPAPGLSYESAGIWSDYFAAACIMLALGATPILIRRSRGRRMRNATPMARITAIASTVVVLATCNVTTYYDVTVATIPSGSGEIVTAAGQPFASDPAGYPAGTTIELLAVPETGYHFLGWDGDSIETQPSISFEVSGTTLLVAQFARDSITVSSDVSPTGSGTVVNTPEAPYHYGDTVELTATAATGYYFVGWTGSSESTANPLSIDLVAAVTLTALFEPDTTDPGDPGDPSDPSDPSDPADGPGGSFTLADIDSGYHVVKAPLSTDSTSEYLLLATIVAAPGTWSEYLPGSGLLVLHIDQTVIDADQASNDVNAGTIHGVAIIEADGNDSLWTIETPPPQNIKPDTGAATDLFFAPDASSLGTVRFNSGLLSSVTVSSITGAPAAAGDSMSFAIAYE